MTFCLGLTGSIATGKSATAALFRAEGVPVWDADATVHRLYALNGAATKLVSALYPEAMENGAVARPKLRALIATNPSVLDAIQALVHPLVAADRAEFLKNTRADIVVLDIPLLFETGVETLCDGIVVVTISPEIQQERVLARGEMTKQELALILSRQMPDVEKRARADWIVETTSMDAAREKVKAILANIQGRIANA
jgi:dephospho-CoA kinase